VRACVRACARAASCLSNREANGRLASEISAMHLVGAALRSYDYDYVGLDARVACSTSMIGTRAVRADSFSLFSRRLVDRSISLASRA